jgi:hypothetical protein
MAAMTAKRLFRILTSAATVLSLLLCLATIAAWVRSYQSHDRRWWSLANPPMQLSVATFKGGWVTSIARPIRNGVIPAPGEGWKHYQPKNYAEAVNLRDTFFNRFSFAMDYFEINECAVRRVACPYWFIMLLAAILPGVWLAGWRRRARHRQSPAFGKLRS